MKYDQQSTIICGYVVLCNYRPALSGTVRNLTPRNFESVPSSLNLIYTSTKGKNILIYSFGKYMKKIFRSVWSSKLNNPYDLLRKKYLLVPVTLIHIRDFMGWCQDFLLYVTVSSAITA